VKFCDLKTKPKLKTWVLLTKNEKQKTV